MKKLLFAVTALAALSLLAPSTGIADTYYNQLGVYTDEAKTSSYMDAAQNSFNLLYVVLSNPYNDDSGELLTSIKGFEFKTVIGAEILEIALTWSLPDALDVGGAGGAGNHIVGLGSPVEVPANGLITLCTINYMVMNDTVPGLVHFAPATPSSIEGKMVILDANSVWTPLYPASSTFANPVFGFNTTIVATETVSMDGIKALYR